jgi:hypothetical protein
MTSASHAIQTDGIQLGLLLTRAATSRAKRVIRAKKEPRMEVNTQCVVKKVTVVVSMSILKE